MMAVETGNKEKLDKVETSGTRETMTTMTMNGITRDKNGKED